MINSKVPQQRQKGRNILSFSIDGNRIDIAHKDMENFVANLTFIDSRMPELFAWISQHCIGNGITTMTEIILELQQKDPLKLQFPAFYQHKIQELLFTLALGMPTSKPWDGTLPDIWTYTITNKDAERQTFSPVNKEEFEKYLINQSTVFNYFII